MIHNVTHHKHTTNVTTNDERVQIYVHGDYFVKGHDVHVTSQRQCGVKLITGECKCILLMNHELNFYQTIPQVSQHLRYHVQGVPRTICHKLITCTSS